MVKTDFCGMDAESGREDVRDSSDALLETAREMRALVRKRGALSAAAAVLPVPGIDIAVDAATFADMLMRINRAFQLSPEQIEMLHTDERLAVLTALSQVSAVFAGRYVTSAAVLTVVKQVGSRWMTGKAAKWVPIAGQGAAAALSYWTVVKLGDAHIAECRRVRDRVRALLAAPKTTNTALGA